MSLKNDVKYLLETSFDMPFVVKTDYHQQEPCITVAPAESNGHLFDIIVQFKNKIRLEMIFEPQKYAAQMVREMGTSSESRRAIFCAYAERLSKKGAKVALKINDTPNDPQHYSTWPDNWEKIFFRTDVRPIEFDQMDKPDYMNTLNHWLPIMMGMSLSLLNVVKVDETEPDLIGRTEGRKYDVITSCYERNPVNRILCLSKYGFSCQICGFDFEKTYGAIGKEFIHVHHKIPVSQLGEDYQVNPLEELIPVCPNCHAMLHRKNPPITPGELKKMIQNHS